MDNQEQCPKCRSKEKDSPRMVGKLADKSMKECEDRWHDA